MTITLEQAKGKIEIMVLSIHGDLDASNYQEAINTAKQAIEQGAQYLLVDMSNITFMSSSGLVALHSIARLMSGDNPPDSEHGWQAFHALDQDLDGGLQERVKLINPPPKVDNSLEITGMKHFFEIHDDIETAIASIP